MRAAYEQLDAETKAQLAGLRVLNAYNNEDVFLPRRAARGKADILVDVSRLLVSIHPVSETKALVIDLDRAKKRDWYTDSRGP
jgi:hypothetical protein